jgi:asparagine synthase (glutamine-hydrolysing)
MCGIAGRFHPDRLPPADGWAARADRLLAHRGPDGSGYFGDERCELVHRRLALIDLSSAGRQPMTNESGDIQVIYNGEIYNHQELRTLLQARGHVFRSTSDTEVLVHLYEERGEQMVELLRGIFAFAIYDAPRRRLLLARDRYGVKPLFYVEHEGQLAFASEIKALTALPRFRPVIDRQACWDFIGLGYIPEPATGFLEIARRAGNDAADRTRGPSRDAVHTVAASPHLGRGLHGHGRAGPRPVARRGQTPGGRRRPRRRVFGRHRLVARGRCASPRDRRRTTTFNVRFPDPRHDETPMAVAVADHVGTGITSSSCATATSVPTGCCRSSATRSTVRRHELHSMYCVPRDPRARIICTLSGDGGDEAFGGYGRFHRANRLARLMALPGWARAAAITAGKALSGVTRDVGRQLAKAAQLAEAGRSDSAVLLAGLSNYLSEEQKEHLLLPAAIEGLEPVYRHFDGYRPASAGTLEELSRRMTEKLFGVSLPSDMLRKVDMMSMRASIESAVPMLDEEMVALGLTLSHRQKMNGREGKMVLRALAREWLPPDVARHPKHGFSIPLDVMATPAVHTAVEDLLLSADARTGWFCNRALVQGWLARFREAAYAPRGGAISRAGLYQRVFTLLSLETWMRDHNLTW